jgi:hypothetical protein
MLLAQVLFHLFPVLPFDVDGALLDQLSAQIGELRRC